MWPDVLDALEAVNVALRFLLELSVLAALGYAGYRIGANGLLRIVLAVGMPVVVAGVWITFGAPGAALLLKDPLHVVLEIVVFFGAAVALVRARQPVFGLALAVLFVINRSLMYAWNQ